MTTTQRNSAHKETSSKTQKRVSSSKSAESHTTTNHDQIREWVEARGGRPARVKSTAEGSDGLLRIDYPGYSGDESLEEITWEAWFEVFDENELAFLYQEHTKDGEVSRFSKLISVPGE